VIALAGHLRLDRLTFLWDDNRMTDDGSIGLAQTEDIDARFRITGWHVQAVDGHDAAAVSAALAAAKADPRPSMIACRTMIGRGIPRLQGQRGAHGGRIFAADTAAARASRLDVAALRDSRRCGRGLARLAARVDQLCRPRPAHCPPALSAPAGGAAMPARPTASRAHLSY
jgi:transketolase